MAAPDPPSDVLKRSTDARYQPGTLSDNPRVTTVVSHLNSARTIAECVRRLARQTFPANQHRIVIVDAGSTDGSIQILRSLNIGNLDLVMEPGCSEAQGQNIGAKSADGDILFFTNSDVYVPPDWINRHVDWQRRGYPIVGGRVAWGGDRYAFAWNYPNWVGVDHGITPGHGLGFGNASIRRDLFDLCGGIPEIHPHQDMEFVLRAASLGATLVLDPEIMVYHDHPFESLRGSLVRSYKYTKNHLVVARFYYGRLAPSSGSPLSGPVVVVPALLKELLGLTGYRAFRDWHRVAQEHSIDIGLVEFMYLRYAARLTGYIAGVLHGLLRPDAISPYRRADLSAATFLGP